MEFGNSGWSELPLEQTLTISGDVAALALPAKDEPPSDSSVALPKDAVKSWSASLSTGIRTPEVRLSGRTGVSMGLEAGYAWLSGSRTPVVPGARFGAQSAPLESRKLDVHGGGFVEPNMRLGVDDLDVILRYRVYHSAADLRKALLLGISIIL